jgi:hypothetical protein
MARAKTGAYKDCSHCGSRFYVTKSRSDIAKYCSMKCSNTANRVERRDVICHRCGNEFSTKADHGVWPKYCCRKCFLGEHEKTKVKSCPSCKKEFTAVLTSHSSSDGFKSYCSKECAGLGLRNGVFRDCLCCGESFYVTPSVESQRKDECCCSKECQHKYYVEDLANGWKGGKYIDTTTGHMRVLHKRDGYISPYLAEHRIIAGEAIGRMLERHEFVIHVNNIKADNRPQNLFICISNSEFSCMRNGSIPWPTKSNLSSYT